jgi:hypothetical protein
MGVSSLISKIRKLSDKSNWGSGLEGRYPGLLLKNLPDPGPVQGG